MPNRRRLWFDYTAEENAAATRKYRQQRKTWINRVKKEAGCKTCGRTNAAVLDFHHRKGTTKNFNISQSLYRAIHVIKLEMEKCDVLCASCHRILHAKERGVKWNMDMEKQYYPKVRKPKQVQPETADWAVEQEPTRTGIDYLAHRRPVLDRDVVY